MNIVETNDRACEGRTWSEKASLQRCLGMLEEERMWVVCISRAKYSQHRELKEALRWEHVWTSRQHLGEPCGCSGLVSSIEQESRSALWFEGRGEMAREIPAFVRISVTITRPAASASSVRWLVCKHSIITEPASLVMLQLSRRFFFMLNFEEQSWQ